MLICAEKAVLREAKKVSWEVRAISVTRRRAEARHSKMFEGSRDQRKSLKAEKSSDFELSSALTASYTL
jgi:hypothetical protein